MSAATFKTSALVLKLKWAAAVALTTSPEVEVVVEGRRERIEIEALNMPQ